jgi:hypothetical protein
MLYHDLYEPYLRISLRVDFYFAYILFDFLQLQLKGTMVTFMQKFLVDLRR